MTKKKLNFIYDIDNVNIISLICMAIQVICILCVFIIDNNIVDWCIISFQIIVLCIHFWLGFTILRRVRKHTKKKK
jgi:tellurite resistance protein TehA-like permease